MRCNSPTRSQIKTSILPPPAKKIDQNPLTKRSRHAIPRPFQPPPPRTIVDCGVVEVSDRAVRSNSPARSQIATSILPPRQKNRSKSPSKNEAATPSPGRSSPRPRVRSLIVVSLRSLTGRCGLICPPDRKLRPLSYPPRRKIRPRSPSKNEAATPSPGRFSPNPVALRWIVMFSTVVTGGIVRFRQPGRKMKAIPPPLPPMNIADFPY